MMLYHENNFYHLFFHLISMLFLSIWNWFWSKVLNIYWKSFILLIQNLKKIHWEFWDVFYFLDVCINKEVMYHVLKVHTKFHKCINKVIMKSKDYIISAADPFMLIHRMYQFLLVCILKEK